MQMALVYMAHISQVIMKNLLVHGQNLWVILFLGLVYVIGLKTEQVVMWTVVTHNIILQALIITGLPLDNVRFCAKSVHTIKQF